MSGQRYHTKKSETAKMRDVCYRLISENRMWRDRYVGTLMMLAYDECITQSRAREIAQMNVYEWRQAFAKYTKTWADGQHDVQRLLREYLRDSKPKKGRRHDR